MLAKLVAETRSLQTLVMDNNHTGPAGFALIRDALAKPSYSLW